MPRTNSGAPDHGRQDHRTQDHRVWQRLAPSGLLLVGAGLCVIADAATRKAARAPTAGWVAEGTGGLTLVGAGLSLFGEAVKRRALFDVEERARG